MKKTLLLVFFCILYIGAWSQINGVVLPEAKAKANTYMPAPGYPFTKAANGDTIMFAWQNHFDTLGHALPIEFIRFNLSKGLYTNVTLPYQPSNQYALWSNPEDSQYNFWSGMNYGVRNLLEIKLDTGIYIRNWGNPFRDGGSLVYRATLGNDGNMNFGASSGDTYISYYDRKGDSIVKYPAIYPAQSYIMMLAGDADFIYSVTGQNGYQLWALRKSDDSTKMIFSVPSSANIGLGNLREGAMANTTYFSGKNDAWWLRGFDTVRGVYGAGNRLEVIEFYNYKTGWNSRIPWVIPYWDAGSSTLSYQIGVGNTTTHAGSIYVPSSNSPSLIKFGFALNNNVIAYVGDNYGSIYTDSLDVHIVTQLGSTGYNLYSVRVVNDTTVLLGGYPNGTIMIWNPTKSWTLNKYNPLTGAAIPLSATSNPRKGIFLRSETPQQNHYVYKMLVDGHGNIVEAGDVIRTQNTATVGTYDYVNNIAYTEDANAVMPLRHYRDLAKLNDSLFALSTDNGFGATRPWLYIWNSYQHKMTDSMSFPLGYGWMPGYGSVYSKGDTLYLIAAARVMKVYLPTKSLVYNVTFNSTMSRKMDDSTLGINYSSGTLPSDFGWKWTKLTYTNYFSDSLDLFAISGYSVLEWAGYFNAPQSIFKTIKKNQRIGIHPNPVSSILYIEDSGMYTIYSMDGRALIRKYITNSVDVSKLANGVYIIQNIKTGAFFRFVVQR